MELQSAPRVRLRYYDSDKGDVHTFDQDLVLGISHKTWKISKYEYLLALLSTFRGSSRENKAPINLIDRDLHKRGSPRPTVDKGRELAISLRRELELQPVKNRAVSVSATLQTLGTSTFLDEMPEAFCGMTLLSPWSGNRVVVANTKGENSRPQVRRFTLAHELAHVVSDPDEYYVSASVGSHAGATGGGKPGKGNRDLPEMRANSFAASFLAPDDEVLAAIDGIDKHEWIDKIGVEFDVSGSVARWRLVSLGLLGRDDPSSSSEGSFFEERSESPSDNISHLDNCIREMSELACSLNLIHEDTVASIDANI